MFGAPSVLAFLTTLVAVQGQRQGVCKEPSVAQRLLADDVRYASPFYVVALPRNAKTEQIDNVCYTYFETGGAFFHIMSVTYSNGTNTFHTYNKGDISNRMGLAEATAVYESQCVFHDYTLIPVCNMTVFVLYRCFIDGKCDSSIDIGNTPGVDVRVSLAANPKISNECRQELEMSLKDTSTLAGGDYVILPQKLQPQCITKYNNTESIGAQRAVGSKQVTDNELEERFGGGEPDTTPLDQNAGSLSSPPVINTVRPISQTTNKAQWPSYPLPKPQVQQKVPNRNAYNPYGTTVNSQPSNQGQYQTTGTRPGYTSVQVHQWPQNSGQWNHRPSNNGQWNSGQGHAGQMALGNGQTVRPAAENHYHIWQHPGVNTVMGKDANVIYHIHSWENPTGGCCKCN